MATTKRSLSSSSSSTPAVDPSLGSWQKHTKGIGLKLLQKYGFNGRLGAKENGISRAIEVVVRPNQEGLGFGSVTEASALKINKKIEAEWRGVEYVDEDELKKKLKKTSSIELLASSKEWKKGGNKTGIGGQNGKISYSADAFIDMYMKNKSADSSGSGVGKQVIIDMRHRDTRIITDMSDISSADMLHEAQSSLDSEKTSQVMLGQELLYNINIISTNHEMNVTKDSKLLAQEVNKIISHQKEIAALKQLVEVDQKRMQRLEKIQQILTKIDDKLKDTTGSKVTLSNISDVYKTLYQNFTEEFSIFGLLSLLPYLFTKIITVDRWHPFVNYTYLGELYDQVMSLVSFFQSIDQLQMGRQVLRAFYDIIETMFLPIIRRTISSMWDVTVEADECVRLIESMKLILPVTMYEQLIDMLVLPKLVSTVNSWKPNLDDSHSSVVPIHVWLHPWLPLLAERLSVVYPEIRRKYHSLISNMHPTNLYHMLPLLTPWVNVFDSTSFENLIVKAIVPKLVLIMREHLMINPANQDIQPFNWVLAWTDLVPQLHFTCLLVGEFFPKWLRVLFTWLTHSQEPDFEEVSIWYQGWKSLFPEGMQSDESIVNCFDVAVDMMQSRLLEGDGGDAEIDVSDEMMKNKLCSPSMLNYKSMLDEMDNIRTYENLIHEKKSILKAKRRLDAINDHEQIGFNNIMRQASVIGMGAAIESAHGKVTFKEVVESFASRNNIEFAPRIGKYFETKQLWHFGSTVCYFDQNVIFASKNDSHDKNYNHKWKGASAGSSNQSNKKEEMDDVSSRRESYNWHPVTLDELLQMSS